MNIYEQQQNVLQNFWDVIELGYIKDLTEEMSDSEDEEMESNSMSISSVSTSSHSQSSNYHSAATNSSKSTKKSLKFEQEKKVTKANKLLKKHFRPKNWRNLNPFPRIFKNDIRRDYPAILVNAINYHDPSMLQQLVHTFCVPSLAYLTHDVIFDETVPINSLISREFGSKRSYDGLDCMLKRAWLLFAEAPDLIVQMQGPAQLCQSNQYSGTKICLNVLMKGNNAFKMSRNIDDIDHHYLQDPPHDYQDLIVIGSKPRHRIIAFELECQFVMFVDNVNKVTAFQFIPLVLRTNKP